MRVEERDIEFQAGSESEFTFTIITDFDLTTYTEAKLVAFLSYDKPSVLFTASTASESGQIRLFVETATKQIKLILPGAATSKLVTKGEAYEGRWQAELRFQDGSQIIFGKGAISIARDMIV
ncbi:hypothetical protein [Escherichia coli]|uniref:hypothetical protein n=1 Tax=Escherichia coli TaxID=562 RepID=UPI000E20D8B5|nr:hypothetical protein [Escherichia coli]